MTEGGDASKPFIMRFDIENGCVRGIRTVKVFDMILFRRPSTCKGIAIKVFSSYPPSIQAAFVKLSSGYEFKC